MLKLRNDLDEANLKIKEGVKNLQIKDEEIEKKAKENESLDKKVAEKDLQISDLESQLG